LSEIGGRLPDDYERNPRLHFHLALPAFPMENYKYRQSPGEVRP
jgi:hypothetical protein